VVRVRAIGGLWLVVTLGIGSWVIARWMSYQVRALVAGTFDAVCRAIAPGVQWLGRRHVFALKVQATQAREVAHLEAMTVASLTGMLAETRAELAEIRAERAARVPCSNGSVSIPLHPDEN
jgi:hypothetical protein